MHPVHTAAGGSKEKEMKRATICGALVVVVAIFLAALSIPVRAGGQMASHSDGVPGSIEGLVRDIACPIANKEATATKFDLQCALACAKNGSPLIILTEEGTLYMPISESMPDKDQRKRLMPFLGKYVKATGQLFERNGTHAIAIKEVHVTNHDQ
jgi:hypothetical protein